MRLTAGRNQHHSLILRTVGMSGESYIPQCSKSTSVQRAYAKINLSLDVTGKRADGYHLVDMIMQTVGIYDTLTVAESDDETDDSGAVSLSIEMENGGTLSAGEDNLICRAVRSMQKEFGIRKEFDIHLIKRIPIAAGMAGGSTDAAAAFRAVRDLAAPSVTDEKLAELAAGLGADIPYCIYGGTKRCRGIGEILTEMPDAPDCSLVIVKPPVGVSTPWCYKTLDQTEITGRPDTEAMIRALDAHDLRAVMGSAGNVLEPVTAAAHSEIGEIEEYLRRFKPVRAMMTGSGPTVFAVFDDAEAAKKAYAAVESDPTFSGYEHFLTGFVKNPYGCRKA